MKVDNLLKQPVDDSFCLNPLELERIVEIFKKGSRLFFKLLFVRRYIELNAFLLD
jgi:hypothetical protein